jgi:hypothetical protein
MVDIRPGMVVITQGNKRSINSWAVRLATGSWWTHGFVTISATEAIDAKVPRTIKIDVAERFALLDKQKRDYIIMEYPGLTDEQREQLADVTRTYEGMLYDIWNALWFLLFNMWIEGGRRLVCSFLMARPFRAIGKGIFTIKSLGRLPATLRHRIPNLRDDACTPDEVLRYSELVEVYRKKN